jgi:hypothetical protein
MFEPVSAWALADQDARDWLFTYFAARKTFHELIQSCFEDSGIQKEEDASCSRRFAQRRSQYI